ncbi:MAG: GTPase HflX [Rickettsiales bacterium]|nr:GTPase HflX [Rickettsiales bacterium]
MADGRACLVVHPHKWVAGESDIRTPSAKLEEAVGLAEAIDLEVKLALLIKLHDVRHSTLFGSGKMDELREAITREHIALVIVNDNLTPSQQRNLEKAWKCKVIDRTALILEIFGQRARTREGKLQVELASLNYQKTRLVRSWTHLERQRGGYGFMGGPGESQIETDRRLINERITQLKRQLTKVTRTRELHRKPRREAPYPTIALVGYTNAGKSTLFNRLTEAHVKAEDQLFATLDPTIRGLELPSGNRVLLSDTVGFIADLPTQLVSAFRATLEEVVGADILLHVRDIADPDTEAQKEDVLDILQELLGDAPLEERMIEVHNKADLLENLSEQEHSDHVRISALTGEGCDSLLLAIDNALEDNFMQQYAFAVPTHEGRALAWLHAHGKVRSETLDEAREHMTLEVSLTRANAERFKKHILPE